MDTLGHLNSRERAVRLAYRKDQHDNGRGWVEPAPVVPAEVASISFEVEAVKADIANIARSYPGGGLTYGWFGDQLRLQFPNSPEVVTVEEAVRRHLIGPGRRW